MTKDKLWRIYCRKNSAFSKEDGTEVRLTARGLREGKITL